MTTPSQLLRHLSLGLFCASLLSCASTKQSAQQDNKDAATAPAAAAPATTSPQSKWEDTADKPDSNGIVKGRYYGEGLDIILGRTVRWCVENGWDIINDGAGANGVVHAKGSIRGFQRVTGAPATGQKAEYPCAVCGSDAKGPIIADQGIMVVRVKTIDFGRTRVIVEFTPVAPDYAPNAQCKTNGKFEQIIMNYLLHD